MADSTATTLTALEPEWRRVELLAGCLLGARRGEPPPADILEELADASRAVEALRAEDAWKPVTGGGLTDLEHDLLAVVVAPTIFPRTGALLANVTGGGARTAFLPTVALVAELYSLPVTHFGALAACLDVDGRLRRRGLVVTGGTEDVWNEPARPGAALVADLLDRPGSAPAPPGARRVPVADTRLGDLVVSAGVRTRLEEFVTAVSNRERMQSWALGPSVGPVAMFSGPSGVGKSLATRAVAGELGWPLFKVDLGALVSKYIGETEKNLNVLFDAAAGRELILHFEEAESLFGRRGEIKEARDRYANLEVSHLLARLEGHDGPCVLSTNLRRNVDPAFVRRFTSVVEFSRPDLEQRAELWRRCLPDGADVDLDEVAAVDLTGGQIRNAATYAGLVTDAATERGLGTDTVALAIWRELTKTGRQVAPGDLGPLASRLGPDLLEEMS